MPPSANVKTQAMQSTIVAASLLVAASSPAPSSPSSPTEGQEVTGKRKGKRKATEGTAAEDSQPPTAAASSASSSGHDAVQARVLNAAAFLNALGDVGIGKGGKGKDKGDDEVHQGNGEVQQSNDEAQQVARWTWINPLTGRYVPYNPHITDGRRVNSREWAFRMGLLGPDGEPTAKGMAGMGKEGVGMGKGKAKGMRKKMKNAKGMGKERRASPEAPQDDIGTKRYPHSLEGHRPVQESRFPLREAEIVEVSVSDSDYSD